MPRENRDLLRQRIPSILYLKAYPRPRRVSEIVAEVYGESRKGPHYYEHKKGFLEKGYMKEVGLQKEIVSMPQPLIDELEKITGTNMRESTRTILYKVLDSWMLRDTLGYVEWAVTKKSSLNPVDPQKGIDSPKVIFNSLTELTAAAYMVRSMEWLLQDEDEKTDEKTTEEHLKEISQKLKLPSPTNEVKTITVPNWVKNNYQKTLSDEDFQAFKGFSLMFPTADERGGFSPTSMHVLPLLSIPKNLLRRISQVTSHGEVTIKTWDQAFGAIASMQCDEVKAKGFKEIYPSVPATPGKDPDILRELIISAKRP